MSEKGDEITIKICILSILLITAMLFDLRSYRVPNKIILIGLVISFGIGLTEEGIHGVIQWGIGILAPLGILSLCYLFHVIGAGDIKLFSVIGSFLGIDQLIRIMVLAFFIGGIMSLIQLIRFRNLSYRLQYLANYIQLLKQSKKIIPYYNKETDNFKAVIPFTAAITISTICILVIT